MSVWVSATFLKTAPKLKINLIKIKIEIKNSVKKMCLNGLQADSLCCMLKCTSVSQSLLSGRFS
jgi:hypothetical protein